MGSKKNYVRRYAGSVHFTIGLQITDASKTKLFPLRFRERKIFMTFVITVLSFLLSNAPFVTVDSLTIWDISVEVPNIRCYYIGFLRNFFDD